SRRVYPDPLVPTTRTAGVFAISRLTVKVPIIPLTHTLRPAGHPRCTGVRMKSWILGTVTSLLAGAALVRADEPPATQAPAAPASQAPAAVEDMAVMPGGPTVPNIPQSRILPDGRVEWTVQGEHYIRDEPDENGPPGRVWFDASYLLWWTKNGHQPPL